MEIGRRGPHVESLTAAICPEVEYQEDRVHDMSLQIGSLVNADEPLGKVASYRYLWSKGVAQKDANEGTQ